MCFCESLIRQNTWYFISSRVNSVYELPPELLKYGCRHRPVSSLPFKSQFLALASKTYAKLDIKVFWSCSLLLDFRTFTKHFVAGCL